ncbi:MAG TPA: LacI family DNA-binding transcriptional regulator, partial [Chthonomonadaceae bacterium]|nr:LacI family DNA-binding transcriptional regulator [Chthonomonadaceae bacterium]
GLIVHAPPDDPLVDLLAASHLPVVAIADAIPQLPSILVDDEAGGRIAAEYLAGRGHRRILYRNIDRPLVSAVRRHDAFCAAAARLGLQVREWRGENDTTLPEDTLWTWLDAPPEQRPTAAFCWNDMAAYDLLAHCRQRGVRVPDDLAVLSFDGLPTPFGTVYQLTSIRAPWVEVARTAVSLLVAQINGETVANETVLPVEFVSGDTA